jgi:autotransporter-associated beta strand protein
MKGFLRTFVAGILPAFVLLLSVQTSRAGSATWLQSPVNGNWNDPNNWSPQTVPGPSDTATFDSLSITTVTLSANTEVGGIVFNAGASSFTIIASPPFTLTMSGVGITNNMLGANNLTVRGNNLSTIFSGSVADSSVFGGPGGGSLTKIGQGTLNLTGGTNYTGGTTVEAGALFVNSGRRSVGVMGPVQVNGGTLGGKGSIFADGDVIIGTESSSGAKLLPGKTPKKPGTLELANTTLIFNSLSTYECVLQRTTATMSNVNGLFGVTINNDVPFTFVDLGTGTLFPVIQSPTSIAGTFSNLPDGSTFTSNGTTFKANYRGRNGNDLTLTVVP